MFGFVPLPRSLRAAVRDSDHEKMEVRLSAVRDLVRHARAGAVEAEAALCRHLTQDPEVEVRAEAALGLADAEVSSGVEALLEAARDPSPRVRKMALLALGELGRTGDPRVTAVLSEARHGDQPSDRFQALLALHQIGAPEAEAAIVEGTVDPDPEIRRLAFRVAEAHFDASRGLSDLVRERARLALRERKSGVTIAAALVLARFGDASGQGTLLDLIGRRAPGATPEDEQGAIEASAELGLTAARPELERRAFGFLRRDPLFWHARVALARLGDTRAQRAVMRGLWARSPDKRTLAVVAAGRARLVEARARVAELGQIPNGADPEAVREALSLLNGRGAS